MNKKAIIFDLDGTILNTLGDLENSLNYALRKSGLPEKTNDEVRRFVGNGVVKLIERSVPEDTDDKTKERLYTDFTEHYSIHYAESTYPYAGITELLGKLKASRLKTAVVSNKADYAVKKLCDKFFKGQFDAVIGSSESMDKKPSPDMVYRVLDIIDCSAGEAVYVGDSEVDIQTAKNAGIPAIIVGWGFRDKDFLIERGAAEVVTDVGRLEKAFLFD